MTKDHIKMETPPSSPQAASPKKCSDTETTIPSTPMSAEDCSHASPARLSSSFTNSDQNGGASMMFGGYQAAPISDLTPVINNSAGYVDTRVPPRFTANLQLDSDSDDEFIVARTSRARGLKQRLSRGNSKESEGSHIPIGEHLSMPSYNSDEFSSLGTSSGSGQMVTSNTVMSGTEAGGAAPIFKQGKGANLAAPIELKPDQKFFSFQCAGQYMQQTEAIPSPGNPVKNQQYQPMLRSQHGVKEMANVQDLDAIFKSPRKAPAKTVVTPDRETPQLQPQDQQKHQNLAQLSQPYPVDDREWSIPSIRLANRVRGHPMDSFASYADFSECTEEESLCSLLDDDDSSLDLSARGARIRRYSGIFQRKPSSGASAHVPQTIYSQDAGDGALPWPSTIVSPLALPHPAIAPSDSLLERMQVISTEDAPRSIDAHAAANKVTEEADAQHSRPRKQHCVSRRLKEGAAKEWLQDLQDQSRDIPIAEAVSSKFLGVGDNSAGQQKRGSAALASPTDMAEDAVMALGMPHPLCRSSTIGAGPFTNQQARGGGGSAAIKSG